MKAKIQFFNYKLMVWTLLIIALIMGGTYLVIAFSYNLQQETERRIDMVRQSVAVAKEMEVELIMMRGYTLTYHVDKSKQWLDSIQRRETRFIILLERARLNAASPEEHLLIQQISALFSNYKQNLITASAKVRSFQFRQADALIVFAARNLLGTILEKSRSFINLNTIAEAAYEKEISRANAIILRVMIFLGIGGTLAGLILGWIISRMIIRPINQLFLQVKAAAGGATLGNLEITNQDDIGQLGEKIKELIAHINKTQADLQRNKELLEYSNKYAVLGKVAPTLAHEIRNPLASIKMLVYTIKEETQVGSEIKNDLEIISAEIDRVEAFIRNFLKFARPAEPMLQPTDPTEVLQEVAQLLKPNLKKNLIECEFQHLAEGRTVMADSGQLKQIFMNLMINAVEVMPNGGKLTLTTSIESPRISGEYIDQEFVRISIEDTGPGIPEKVMKHLFEPFIKASEHGVGLGLSISQNIANLHKGWVEAENKPDGSGAVFSVLLPLSKT